MQGKAFLTASSNAQAPGQDPAEGLEILSASERMAISLRSGTSQAEVARRARKPMEYAIGMMIFRLCEKRHLEDMDIAFRLLSAKFEGSNSRSTAEPVNRRTVIEALRKLSLIEPGLSVRTIKPVGTTPTVTQVLRVTEQVTQVSIENILSSSRLRNIVDARFFAMYALRVVSGSPLSLIGESFGGKDHTTVMNAVNQVYLKRLTQQEWRVATDQIVDISDLIGIQSNMDLLTKASTLRAI